MSQIERFFKLKTLLDGELSYEMWTNFWKWNIVQDT
jgi:hypothetical protein